MHQKKYFHFSILLLLSLFIFSVSAQQRNYHAGEIQLALKKLNTAGTALYLAAHPDDENTRLLSYLANEKMLRTAYLSLTRGDGGQNLIGTEQAEKLGLIRTQELLAARKTDGAEQFFTLANDFGYSKTPEETMKIWGKETILANVVWIIRKFRPDIIITRFPTTGEGGHGHHTASAIIAVEAFTAAADPTQFPEQLKHVQPWQTKRLVWNNFIPQRDAKADVSKLIKLDVGAYNPLLGRSYGEIAADSRSMHKSQGFGVAKGRGSTFEYFTPLKGDTSIEDLFKGIDFSWSRIKGSEKISQLFSDANAQFKPEKPEQIIPQLLAAYKALDNLQDEYWKEQKRKELQELILACSGLWFEAQAADYSATPGSKIKVTLPIVKRSSFPVTLNNIRFTGGTDTLINKALSNNELIQSEKQLLVPANVPYTNPYWLNTLPANGTFKVKDPLLVGIPENPPAIMADFTFTIGDQSFTFSRPLVYKWVDPVDGERYRPFEVIPEVTANLDKETYIFTDHQSKKVQVLLKAGTNNVAGTVKLVLPLGWKYEPASLPFTMKVKGEETVMDFIVHPPKNGASKKEPYFIHAIAEVSGKELTKSIRRIEYKHIPIQLLLPESKAKLVPLEVIKKGQKIGYIVGAGDEVPGSLEQLGYHVTLLHNEQLETQFLSDFDVIVVGIRAYNTNERMRHYHKKLMDYVAAGGTMVVQYNTNNFLGTIKSDIGPYPFKISRDRVTVEQAPITFEKPEHPILNYPNKITEKDFEDWIQERGLYFANEWDPHYEAILSSNDPGEKPSKGMLLVAQHGKGYFVYTGLAFFRQLPAGVPGAYRLFANIMSLGKK